MLDLETSTDVVDAVAESGVRLGSALRSREGVVRVLEADAVAAWDGPGMVISAVGCEACISRSEREQPQRAAIIVEAEDMPATTLTPPYRTRAQGVPRAAPDVSALSALRAPYTLHAGHVGIEGGLGDLSTRIAAGGEVVVDSALGVAVLTVAGIIDL